MVWRYTVGHDLPLWCVPRRTVSDSRGQPSVPNIPPFPKMKTLSPFKRKKYICFLVSGSSMPHLLQSSRKQKALLSIMVSGNQCPALQGRTSHICSSSGLQIKALNLERNKQLRYTINLKKIYIYVISVGILSLLWSDTDNI